MAFDSVETKEPSTGGTAFKTDLISAVHTQIVKLDGGAEGSSVPIKSDPATGALNTIDHAHHEIHSGSSFAVHIDNITASADNARTLLGFETPAGTKWAHLVVIASASAAAEVFLYEGVTIDDDEGTELTILDRNRNTANTSTMLSFEATPVAGQATWMTEAQVNGANFSATTILDHHILVAGAGPKPAGGNTRSTQEWVLAPSTKYAVVVQNIGALVNTHAITLDWYEHTDL